MKKESLKFPLHKNASADTSIHEGDVNKPVSLTTGMENRLLGYCLLGCNVV
jgi:hypothetical protein